MARLFDLQNPLPLIIAAAVALLAIGLLVFILVRLFKRRAERGVVAETDRIAMEREWQFATAAEQLRYLKDPSEVAKEITSLFREFLSMNVLAVYAGRQRDERISNVFPEREGPDRRSSQSMQALPQSFPATLIGEYHQPRLTNLHSLIGGGSPAPGEVPGQRSYQTSELQEGGGPAANRAPDARIAVLPWRGAFEWVGLVVASANESLNSETLGRYVDPLTHLSDRLAVALELKRGREELDLANERAIRTAGFYRSLITSLEEAAPLASVAQEVATLVGSDSAAIWRVDLGGSMLRMVSSHGLRATEFLPLPIGQGLAGTVAQTDEPLAIEDAPSDPRCLFPREARESGITSYLGVPVRSGDEVIAVVEVHTAEKRAWERADAMALKSAAASIAEVVKSTDARGIRLRVENAYLGLAEAMQRLLSREEVLEAVVEVLGHALGVSRALVIEVNQSGSPEPVTHEYRGHATTAASASSLIGEVAARLTAAVASGEPIALADSREHSL